MRWTKPAKRDRGADLRHGPGKSALVDYFDHAYELEATLKAKGKSLDVLAPSNVTFGEVIPFASSSRSALATQSGARGISWATNLRRASPDELMIGSPNCLAQMMEAYDRVGGNIVAALEVPASETHKYGVIDPGPSNGRLTQIRGMVEKPAAGTAPSNLMLPGRYILQPEVMRQLDAQEAGAGGEIQLTDAMARLIGTQPFHAFFVRRSRYDCGSAEGFVIANPRWRWSAKTSASRCARVHRAALARISSAPREAHQSGLPVRSRVRRARHCRPLQPLHRTCPPDSPLDTCGQNLEMKWLHDHVVGARLIGAHRASRL